MNTIILSAKAPLKGYVKTRLLKNTPLNEGEVCELYRAFLKDTLAVIGGSCAERVVVSYTPNERGEEMLELASENIKGKEVFIVPMDGKTYTEMVAAGFEFASSKGAGSRVGIGSDSPTLQSVTIDQAFEKLNGDAGAVVGPSAEGGMYLVGIKGSIKLDFHKIFGGGSELANFSHEVEKAGIPLFILEELSDVDVAVDLVTLISVIESQKVARTFQQMDFPENTARIIEKLKLEIVRNSGTRDKVIVKGE